MNNRGSIVACPLNHCLLSKQSLFVCRKDFCTMDVLPFVIFSMLLLIIIYPFVCDVGASLESTQRQDHSTHVSSSRNSTLIVAADFKICLHSASEFTFGGTLEPMPNFTL
jgi:hypothetical protein